MKTQGFVLAGPRPKGYPTTDYHPFTLADKGGVWCAWCLEYISKAPPRKGDECEMHHVVRDSFVKSLFNGKNPADHWIVPVHRHCHRPFIDGISAATKTNLEIILSGTLGELIDAAKRLHNGGHVGLAMLVNWELMKRMSPEDDQARSKIRAHILAAESAAKWSVPLDAFALPTETDQILLNKAKHAARGGKLQLAEATLARADEKIVLAKGLEHDSLDAARNRARISIFLDCPDSGGDGLKGAMANVDRAVGEQDDDYVRSGVRLAKGEILFRYTNEVSQARYEVESLFDYSSRLSWLYRAEAFLHLALFELDAHGSLEVAYKWLIRAQFIWCMPGYQGKTRLGGDRLRDLQKLNCTPGHVLLSYLALEPDRSRMTQLRREAIGSLKDPNSIFQQLANELITCCRV